jgi:hypothetical protein
VIVATLCGAARSAARTRDAPGRRPGLDTYKSVFRQQSLPKHFSGGASGGPGSRSPSKDGPPVRRRGGVAQGEVGSVSLHAMRKRPGGR